MERMRINSGLVVAMVVVAGVLAMARTAEAVNKPAMTWNPAHSSNYTDSSRPNSYPIEYVMIHITEGSYAGAISWFKNSASNVSAHYVISLQGAITNMVADQDIAWTNGNSYYNARGIGIEHEGYSSSNTWTSAQLNASAQLTAWYCQTYSIPADANHILLHKEVRSTACPGTYFDKSAYIALVNSYLGGGGGGATYDAQKTVHTQPQQLTSGNNDVVWLELKNTGTTTWDSTNTSLSFIDGGNSQFWANWNWVDGDTATKLDVPTSVAPGETGTFAFVALAPTVAQSTVITQNFRLHDARKGGDGLFGPTIAVTIQINPVAGPLTIATDSLPNATYQQSYDQGIQVSGGTPGYSFTIESGNLPAGITLNSQSGRLTGTAAQAGSFTIEIGVTDSANPQASQRKTYTLNVVGAANNAPAPPACTMTTGPGNPMLLAIFALMFAFATMLRRRAA